MANSDETFDPNDLESIDALLDEAELEAVADEPELPEASDTEVSEPEPESTSAQETESESEPEAESEADAVADSEPEEPPAVEEEETDDILDSLDEMISDSESQEDAEQAESPLEELAEDIEPEVVSVSEPVAKKQAQSDKADMNPQEELQKEQEIDDFLEKRAAAQASKNSNLSVKEMEAIKKLIIIFGSVLSVLALAGIGIGVWSAMAASSAGVDDETKTLIESIKVATEQNGSQIAAAESVTQSVEKKLDAINFQLEQLAVDFAEMEKAGAEAKSDVLDPLGLKEKSKADTAKEEKTAAVAVAPDPQLMKKMNAVNGKLIRAQRRMDEVNKRVKKLQTQYGAMLQSIKLIEKQALIEQAEREAAEKELAEKKKSSNRYQYSAPDGMFYDQSVTDSYP